MKEAVIVEAVRTPMGRHSGILKDVRTDDLGAYIIAKLVEKTGINKEEIEDVYFGCTNQAGEDSRNVARNASLLAGLPYTIPGATVNRLCGSGLEAINQAGRAVETDHGEFFSTRRRDHVRQLLGLAFPEQAHGRTILADQQW
jgi:acetyl-CoA acetyltransferase